MTEPSVRGQSTGGGDADGPEQHPFHRLSPLTPVVRGGIFLVAIVATSWDDLLRGDLGPIGMILVGVLAAGVVYGFASWLRTKYWIEPDELRVDTGVLNHQSRRIRIDRIQGIDIVQPAIARVFGLAELKIDVAGGQREGSLAFLPLTEAHQVREVLLARRDAVRRTTTAPGEPAAEDQGEAPPGWAPPDHDIARLDLGMLVVSLLLAPETLWLVLSAGVVTVLSLVSGGLAFAPMLPVVIGFALVQLRKLSAYYGFTVSQTHVGLQVRRGLLERSTQTINLARVQGVMVSEPWLWQRLGWVRLDVSVAGYGDGGESDGRPAATTVMPVAPRPLVMELAGHVLGGMPDLDAVPLEPAPARARWLRPLGWRRLGFGSGSGVVVSREGWLGRRTHVAPHARVQSVRLRQGPVQRLLGLADVLVDSPPGPVRVRGRHRPAEVARALLDAECERAREARTAARTAAGPDQSSR